MAIPALSEKLSKWHFLTPAWNLLFLGPNVFFWCTVKVPLSDFFPNMSQGPSKCFNKWMNWINWIISKTIQAISKILLILGLQTFLACLECVSRNGLSFVHSDWDIITVHTKALVRCCIRFYETVFSMLLWASGCPPGDLRVTAGWLYQ